MYFLMGEVPLKGGVISWGVTTYQYYQLLSVSQLITELIRHAQGLALGLSCERGGYISVLSAGG